jgi:DNA adenine methylase
MTITTRGFRYHGEKFRVTPWMLHHLPSHTCEVESCCGAAGVLMQNPRFYAEAYNYLDGDAVNFFRVLQDPVSRS